MTAEGFGQETRAGRLTRRGWLQGGLALALAGVLARCGAPMGLGGASDEALLASGGSIPLDRLVKAAQGEGMLNTIALPHDWANYGRMLQVFEQKFGLKLNELAPDAGSGEELEAVRRAKSGSQVDEAPDVLDIGLGFTAPGMAEELFAAYKVATWETIPENLKEPNGQWVGDYYGVLAFEANLDIVKNVPQDWSDLLKPEYKQMVALAGDPTNSSQAVYSVWAAGLARTGSLEEAPLAGLEFFAELQRAGNFLPQIADVKTLASGETPITVQWDYLGLANRDTLQGRPEVAVVVPRSGILAGLYAQAISIAAPHPFAARLWQEFIYSDEGQLLYLQGYVHPVRYQDLVKRFQVSAELEAQLPPAENYARAVFPTLEQITHANQIITSRWHEMVMG
jgi:putative spermidine/putrescine transport system substrate-binding protein